MQDRNGSVSRRCVRRVLTMVGNLEKNERMIREHRATDEWTIELGGRSSQAPSRTIASGGGNRLEMDPDSATRTSWSGVALTARDSPLGRLQKGFGEMALVALHDRGPLRSHSLPHPQWDTPPCPEHVPWRCSE